MGMIRVLFRYVAPLPAPNLITYAELKRLGACGSQLARFKRTFGRSVLVTEELAAEHCERFDVRWAVEAFLTDEGRRLWLSSRDGYWAALSLKELRSRDVSELTRLTAASFARLLLTHRRR